MPPFQNNLPAIMSFVLSLACSDCYIKSVEQQYQYQLRKSVSFY